MQEGEVIALLGVCAATMVILFPIVRALADRIRPRAVDGRLHEEIQTLREDVLSEVQQARHEIAELSERVDFTERLLAKKSER